MNCEPTGGALTLSVSRQQYEAVPIRPVTRSKTDESSHPEDRLTIVEGKGDATEFWDEFNRTLDEFFRTVNASKRHIQSLCKKVAERDRRIEMLEAENAALRDQHELQRSAQTPSSTRPAMETARPDVSVATQRPRPAEDRKPGIWSKLSRLEHESDAR
jgi:predicted ribosome quality control (RQC) complex YloA/Tae2 family protein